MNIKVYKPKDAVILGMISQYPKQGKKYLKHLDKKLKPLGNAFVSGKASAKVAAKDGKMIRDLAEWGGVVTVKETKARKGFVIG